MKILVLVKQTFDTEEKIVLKDGRVNDEGVNLIMNPYDEYAVEEAIRLKEASGAEVVAISFGPERAESALRTALAMGADRAVLVEAGSDAADESVAAKALAAVARRESFDLVLCGYMSVDNGAAQTGPRLAEELDIPHISSVTKLTIDGRSVTAVRDAEGDTETVEGELPLLVTAQQGLNEPRYPSLPGIMKAKKKPLERIALSELGLSAGDMSAKTAVTDIFLPAKRQGGKILQGDMDEQAAELARLLRDEAKVV
jgi:electron transfer flavoprotein beta subunit